MLAENNFPTAHSLGAKILAHAQNALLLQLRFLSLALYKLKLSPWPFQEQKDVLHIVPSNFPALATDGKYLHFDGMGVVGLYKAESRAIPRKYLHVVMHCIFNHPFVGAGMDSRAWDLACDIAVEMAVSELGLSSLQVNPPPSQNPFVKLLLKEGVPLTAERIYLYLRSQPSDDVRNYYECARYFYVDDHSIWYPKPQEEDNENSADDRENYSGNVNEAPDGNGKSDGDDADGESYAQYNDNDSDNINDNPSGDGKNDSLQTNLQSSRTGAASNPSAAEWKELAAKIQEELETFAKSQGDTAGHLTQNLLAVTRERHDYTAFLRRFAVLSEEMQINSDEFDYIYYTYGLRLYSNLPLIEPLEYQDVLRVREFVIAIDTSGSVHGMEVQAFIQKTYNILKQSESFASRVRIHIIQCDADIQEVATINHLDELDGYIQNLTIKGFGGTDFRPVFCYVDGQIAARNFTDLRGLIYFTDGLGTFPDYMPAYQTAFVFVESEAAHNHKIPVWAIKILLEPGGLAYV